MAGDGSSSGLGCRNLQQADLQPSSGIREYSRTQLHSLERRTEKREFALARFLIRPQRDASLLWPTSLIVVLSMIGCGVNGATSDQRLSEQQLRSVLIVVGLEYGAYCEANRKQAPKDEATFRNYLAKRLSQLQFYNVRSVDDLFVNGRDGEPIVIAYGSLQTDPEDPEYPLVAWEKRGSNGARLAVNTRGGVAEYPSDEFATKFPGL